LLVREHQKRFELLAKEVGARRVLESQRGERIEGLVPPAIACFYSHFDFSQIMTYFYGCSKLQILII
jgi:hypothetical protein